MYKLNPTTGQLKFNGIIEYQSYVDFINDIKEKVKGENLFEQVSNEKLLEKVKEKLSKDKIEAILSSFKSYFEHYQSIKSLDNDFDGSEGIHQNIKKVLYNSILKTELFKKDFRVYDMTIKK